VNLAVFDHAFQGRPERRPIATLTWKDWRGEPEVVFPGRPSSPGGNATKSSVPPQAAISSPPATAVPSTAKSATHAAPAAPAAPRPAAPAVAVVTKPAAPKARSTGDVLLAELADACADLGFLSDPLEGADFVLALAMEKIPSEIGLVSLFDKDKKEFFVVRQSGGKTQCVGAVIPDRSSLAQAALRAHRGVVIPDAVRDPRAVDARWKAMGVEPKSIVCAPVVAAGRTLGLIELVNPSGSSRYGNSEGNALTYIGQQFAQFLAGQRVAIDRAKLLGSARKEAR
jgi:hypothetical protein